MRNRRALDRGIRIAAGCQHGGDRRVIGEREWRRRLPSSHSSETLRESVRHQRQHHLGLGVAEPAVELDHVAACPSGVHHQAGVQHAAEGRAAPAQSPRARAASTSRARSLEQRRRGDARPGCRRPCRRCWAPRRPRAGACGPAPRAAARRRVPSVTARTETSSPSRNASMTTVAPGVAERAVAEHRAHRGGGLRAGGADDRALARREARRLHHQRLGCRRRTRAPPRDR